MKKWKLWMPAALILFSVLLNILARRCQTFADFYVEHIFPLWAAAYGRITGVLPFSLGEWMLYLAAVLLFLLIMGGSIYGIFRKRISYKWKVWYGKYTLFIYWIVGIVCVVMTLNCFLLYQVSPMNKRFDIGGSEEKEYGAKELSILRDYVVERANALAGEFDRDERGYLIYQTDFKGEAKAQLRRLGEEFDNLSGYYPDPKGLFLSGFYSQQYIMGYYFPFSMEANFISYLACVDSKDPLFQYSAYLSVLGYLDRDFFEAMGKDWGIYLSHPKISELTAADKKFLTDEAWEQVEEKAVLSTEMVKQAADIFLDTTLALNEVAEGRASYSRVVNLLLQYYDGKLY